MSKRHSPAFVSFLFDLGVLAALFAVIWFFLGHFLQANYFETGYQDFSAHAYRIEEIERHGIASWTFSWGNGTNIWRSYQYIPHLLTLVVKNIFHLSTMQAMLTTLFVLACFSVFSVFIVLRKLNVHRGIAFLACLMFFVTPQVYGAMMDYSIFFTLPLMPWVLYVFINDVKFSRNSLALPTAAALSFYIHPIAGYVLTYIWLWTFTLTLDAKNLGRLVSRLLIYLFFLSPFLAPYLLKGYFYSNPVYSSVHFVSVNLIGDNLGLGFFISVGLVLSWIVLLIHSTSIKKWTKLLLLLLSFLLFAVYLAKTGFLPSLVLSLQIGRATSLIAVLLLIAFGSIFDHIFNIRSRFLQMIPVAILAILLVSSAETVSRYTSSLTFKRNKSPIEYLQAVSAPKGLVYINDVSEASYYSKGEINFFTTYIGHLDAQPLSQRFYGLTQGGMSYTGVSKKQTDLIADYATLYGIEYLIIPKFSPIVANLTATGSATPAFTIADIPSQDAQLAFLQSTRQPASAYAVLNDNLISFDEFEKPNLNVVSWRPWDDEVTHLANAIREGTLVPVPLKKIGREQFEVDLQAMPATSSGLLVTISHDQNWKATDTRENSILPTALKMMYVHHSDLPDAKTLRFEHHWPTWHWPLQIGVGVIGILVIIGDQLYWYLAGLHTARLQRKEEQHVPKKI